ncbi:MAG: NAD(P)(+) transhydrogenase (Re/Si-specific) subunit beta [Puniceicoccales bacterium]|jgi:NAD(P) transhydrogenase subunit beta|nr:NAD(P)(+) transhydrogenase (Re/Si-specific) subunit beta [Puniceicoccales bacterium]
MRDFVGVAYVFASILFIIGIKLLARADRARVGNLISGTGMLTALVATLIGSNVLSIGTTIVAIAIGTIVGMLMAYRVRMIALPEMVALLNGLGGLASVFVAVAEFHRISTLGWLKYFTWCDVQYTESAIYGASFATFAAVFIGAITFTGSLVAYLKLAGKMKRQFGVKRSLNVALLVIISIMWLFFTVREISSLGMIYAALAISLILGVTSVMAIGGGDMPVVISLLNSLSGMAAAETGFILSNVVLVVAGCLVGTSGLVLTVIMCKAMNRSLGNFLLGGFGSSGEAASIGNEEPKFTSVEDAYYVLEAARNIVFVPGYGMAVAQAQHVVNELGAILENNGADVTYAIHPVAGRMPGHMNVLLAEADVSYEQLVDMETANSGMASVDVAIVIGANDVVNPAAANDKNSPIYGMPIINVHLAKSVFVLKRGSGTGFSGLQNALFMMENTRMIYGDAKKTISALVASFKNR